MTHFSADKVASRPTWVAIGSVQSLAEQCSSVEVLQGSLAYVDLRPTDPSDHPCVFTTGLNTCVGVVLKKGSDVCIAHWDGPSVRQTTEEGAVDLFRLFKQHISKHLPVPETAAALKGWFLYMAGGTSETAPHFVRALLGAARAAGIRDVSVLPPNPFIDGTTDLLADQDSLYYSQHR
jgi:hypothetical protein